MLAALSMPKLPDAKKEFFAKTPRWFDQIAQAGQRLFLNLWFESGFKGGKIRITDWQIAALCGRSLRWAQKAIRQLLDFVLDGEPFPLIDRYRVYGHRNESGRVIEIIVDFSEAKPKPKPEPKAKAKASGPASVPVAAAVPPVASDETPAAGPTAEEQRQAAERLKELLARSKAEQAAKAPPRRTGPSLASSANVPPEEERRRDVAELARIEAIPADQRSSLLEQIRAKLAAKLGASRPARE